MKNDNFTEGAQHRSNKTLYLKIRMNIAPKDLVEGKKYRLLLVDKGKEYPQGEAVFLGLEKQDPEQINSNSLVDRVALWQTSNVGSTNPMFEIKKFPVLSLKYRSVNGGTRNRRKSNRKRRTMRH